MSTLLDVRALRTHLHLREGILKAVDGVGLAVKKGEVVGLVGESGCGKTMTALSIIRLTPTPPAKIEGGEVLYEGRNLLDLSMKEMIHVRGKKISMIFQEPMTSLNPVLKPLKSSMKKDS